VIVTVLTIWRHQQMPGFHLGFGFHWLKYYRINPLGLTEWLESRLAQQLLNAGWMAM